MSVRKRTWTTSKGERRSSFIVDYTDSEGDRHIKTFDREKNAKAYHAKVAVNVAQGVHVAPSKSLTVREAAEVWIKRVEARAGNAALCANTGSTWTCISIRASAPSSFKSHDQDCGGFPRRLADEDDAADGAQGNDLLEVAAQGRADEPCDGRCRGSCQAEAGSEASSR